jgi:hypothetical protein
MTTDSFIHVILPLTTVACALTEDVQQELVSSSAARRSSAGAGQPTGYLPCRFPYENLQRGLEAHALCYQHLQSFLCAT